MASDQGFLEQHRHGKARVRVGRVWRNGPFHTFVEWSVSVYLYSDCDAAFSEGDNSAIVATDTMKNTVYVIAQQCKDVVSMEEFAGILGQHFVKTYSVVTGAQVNIIEKPWEPVTVDGKAHSHGYKLGKGSHTCEVIVRDNGSVVVSSGINELSILKTTQSGFEAFIRDKYTLLPEVRERMFATEVRATWRYCSKPSCYNQTFETVKNILLTTFFGPHDTGVYSPSVQNTLYLMGQEVLKRVPEIESIKLSMPNLHFLPVNMPAIGVNFKDDVYLPVDEPHGAIEALLTRKGFAGRSRL